MKLSMRIEPAVFEKKVGWFGKDRIPVHNIIVDLQLTEKEKKTIREAGIMGQPLVYQDYEAIGWTAEQNELAYPGSKPYS